MQKYLLAGLGNPGEKFADTRHNLGQFILQSFAAPDGVEVYFPKVFMNDAGPDVAAYMRKNGWKLDQLVVVHDELELPLGEIAWQQGGSAHGHNGIRSLIASFGSPDFRRLRLGIGRPTTEQPVDQFVLSAFKDDEKIALKNIQNKAAVLLQEYLLGSSV